ncbi:MAG: hypothetical protein A3K10_17220 [Bacteroidetes bacterium RIFCSPLOWO2_12_FULL_31_6]|nr:MAG: hypothetical protein A3K10_17220 [Bacteroidetes bacterium RIFCSPLOWO2_12_FULL_31_6]
MVKLSGKIEAFTLMESMTSIVIVMIAFSLASIVIVNMSTSGMTREKQNAYMLVKTMRYESLLQDRFIDETIESDDLIIEKTILDYGKSEDLKVLLIEAFKGKKKLFTTKDLIVLKQAK